MKLPAYPVQGQPLDHRWGRQLVDYLRWITPQFQPAPRRKMPVRTPAPGQANEHPFQVVQTGDLTIKVRLGTWNGRWIPTINGSELTASLDESPELTLDGSDDKIYFEVNWNEEGGSASLVGVQIKSVSGGLPDDTETMHNHLLAGVSIDGGGISSINNTVTTSMAYRKCGISHLTTAS